MKKNILNQHVLWLFCLFLLQKGQAQYQLFAQSINNGGVTVCIPGSNYRHHATIGNVIGGVQSANGYTSSTAFVYAALPFLPLDNADCTPLAVQLDLSAYPVEQSAILNWTVVADISIQSFEIQRSSNGHTFSYLHKTIASTDKDYRFEDRNAFLTQDTWFYRIKSQDIDGNSEYSPIVEVHVWDKIKTSLISYPNPTNDYFTLEYVSPEATTIICVLYNASGQMVMTWQDEIVLGKNVFQKNIAQLSNGIYFLKVNGEPITTKLVKQ